MKTGKTIFFKANGDWMIIGPTADVQVGQRVTVSKADGSTSEVIVSAIKAERTVQDTPTRTATFTQAPARPSGGLASVVEPPKAATRSAEYADVSDADLINEFEDVRREYMGVAGTPLDDLTRRQRLLVAAYDKVKAEMDARGLDTTPKPARRFGRKPGASGKA